MFWVLHGVLKEVEPDTFAVLEQAETSTPNPSASSHLERLTIDIPASLASAPSNIQSAEEQQESEMQMYWYELEDGHMLTEGYLSLGCLRILAFCRWRGSIRCYPCSCRRRMHTTGRRKNYGISLPRKYERVNWSLSKARAVGTNSFNSRTASSKRETATALPENAIKFAPPKLCKYYHDVTIRCMQQIPTNQSPISEISSSKVSLPSSISSR